MTTTFDPNLPGLMEGQIDNVTVAEAPPVVTMGLANHVIDPTKPFIITVQWHVFGALTPLWLNALANNWTVTAYAESIGQGPEMTLSQTAVPVGAPPAGNPQAYVANLAIPAGTLPEDGAGASGLYRIVVTTFLNSALEVPGFDLMGYADGPLVQIENPV